MSYSHQWVRCRCGRSGYLGELRHHMRRCTGGLFGFGFGARRYYGGGRETENESYWGDEEGIGCRDCGNPGPEQHRHMGICPDMIRLEPHMQRLLNNARREGRYGRYGRGRYPRQYSYDGLDYPYDGIGRDDRYRRSRSRDRLANAVEDLAGAVDDAGQDRRYGRRRRHEHGGYHHHHHRHDHHDHHHRRHDRYGRRRYRSYTPRHRRSRSVDIDSDWSDSDDGYDNYAYDGRYRNRDGLRGRPDAVVDDLADALQRAQLLRELGDQNRGNQRVMREAIRNL